MLTEMYLNFMDGLKRSGVYQSTMMKLIHVT